MNRYYLWKANAETGPFSIGQVRSMWANGSVTVDTLYRTEDDGNWYSLSRIEGDLDPSSRPSSTIPAMGAVMRSERPHVKATTERTNKPIKATMALCALGLLVCICGSIVDDGPTRIFFIVGMPACAAGYLFAKIARWWENE